MKEKNTELNSRLYRFASSFFSKSLESRTANALVRHKSDGEGLISGSAETLDRKYLVPAKRAVSSACEKSRILAFINGCLDEIMLMPVKTLGLIYFAAGVYILIKCILGRFISTFSTDSDYLTCGALCTVFAGTVMSSSRSVRSAISNSRICSAVAREVFGAVFEFEDEPKAIAGVFPAIITGLAMGELSFHTSFAFAVLLLRFFFTLMFVIAVAVEFVVDVPAV